MTTTDKPHDAMIAQLRAHGDGQLADAIQELQREADEWREKWRYERTHACPHWGHHTSDGKERVCWYDKPDEDRMNRRRAEKAEAERDALRVDAERLTDMLLVRGALDEYPCFICGYNGPGYWQPSTHPCVKRRSACLARDDDTARALGEER